ncbi:L,D-transpeptidase [Rhizobium tumorigenes]|uniref:L,D-transpeptidase n=1 Tax=Rhizobium tumorigenes TaxID=2041385 RepID=A0AAF1K709_9HYPH|nr:L,D-transpeptidase [Rhizobium tumorigenes]WFR95896.1 L,D-transpeptidase [Rhizobium tumorigenes]
MKQVIRLMAATAIALTSMIAVTTPAPMTTANDAVRNVKPNRTVPAEFHKRLVRLVTDEAPGTIIVDTNNKFLYLVEGNNRATRYGIGVGRDGFGWSGIVTVGRKAEWPVWTPPAEMRVREAREGHPLPASVPGGEANPLGARAMYLYQNGHDTIFRIHGTNQPWTIGLNLSSGCIRMMNADVADLYDHVPVGTKVIVVGPGNKQGEVSYKDHGMDVLRTLFGGFGG